MELLNDDRPGKSRRAVQTALEGAERLYAFGLRSYLQLETLGFRSRLRPPVAVISIGNLSVGGTGKTPATQFLAKSFQNRGARVAILSRGHGGKAKQVPIPVSGLQGEILTTIDVSGDEPMLLAQSLPGIPVTVCKDRRKSARFAISQYSPDVMLLDDAFQYWQLARDLDIVLLDATAPFGNGHALPRGLLREPKSNLSRAQVVILTRSERLTALDRNTREDSVRAVAPSARLFYARHAVRDVVPWNAAASKMVLPERPIAVCGISQPSSFLASLSQVGVEVLDELLLDDHATYAPAVITSLLGKLSRSGAQSIVTTEKDVVKLNACIPAIPIFVLQIGFEVERSDVLLSECFSLLGGQLGYCADEFNC